MKYVALVSLGLIAASAQSSQYPPEYSHQTVYAISQGPVLVAHVGSGFGSIDVIGYKNAGPLAARNAESLDAVIEGRCLNRDGSEAVKRSVIKLGREYHGTGYMSAPLSLRYDFYPESCKFGQNKPDLQLAISDGQNNWDSLFGANYRLNADMFYNNRETVVFPTHEAGPWGSSDVNQKAWDFIVDQMRK